MFALIVGCGRVGSTVARAMLREGHEVSCLDEDPESHARLEVGSRLGHDDAGDRVLDERVEEMALAREVVVDAHRLAAEALAELARAERREALLLDDRERGIDDALGRQGLAATAAVRHG